MICKCGKGGKGHVKGSGAETENVLQWVPGTLLSYFVTKSHCMFSFNNYDVFRQRLENARHKDTMKR